MYVLTCTPLHYIIDMVTPTICALTYMPMGHMWSRTTPGNGLLRFSPSSGSGRVAMYVAREVLASKGKKREYRRDEGEKEGTTEEEREIGFTMFHGGYKKMAPYRGHKATLTFRTR